MKTSIHLAIAKLLTTAAKRKASDIHLIPGSYPVFRIDETLTEVTQEEIISNEFIKSFLSLILSEQQQEQLNKNKSIRVVYFFEDKVRFRVNVFYQKNVLAVSLKLIPVKVPSFKDLNLPSHFKKLIELKRGLVVVSGPYNSGKTTTVAAILEEINKLRSVNMITLEDPIEYIFFNNKSLIEQRQIGRDVNSYLDGLQYCQNEDVDIIVVDDTTDPDVIHTLLDLADTGHLVFYIINASSVLQSIEKILNSYHTSEFERAQQLLSRCCIAVISQRLIPKTTGGLASAFDILFTNDAVQTLIRDGKISQLTTIMQTSQDEGMTTLDQSIAMLVKRGEISTETALDQAIDKNNFITMIRS